jgi:plasmid rolling circle replication initiator protein Rep
MGTTEAAHCVHFIVAHTNCNDTLSVHSPRDAVWDAHRAQTDDVGAIYGAAAGFDRYASRMAACSGLLHFASVSAPDTGEIRLRLRQASFCRVRHCPVCQWRRAMMWQARFFQALPGLVQAHQTARWAFLTLTVQNCPVADLKAVLKGMNEAWNRFVQRQEFRSVLGWIRTTEITKAKDGKAHPHFHVLMMIPPSMVSGKNYVKQDRWACLWKESMRINYDPIIDIRMVKPKKGADSSSALEAAAIETLKYSVKPSDMTDDPEWFLELTRQTHRRRFLASGGVLKDVLRESEETDDQLALVDTPADEADDGSTLAFGWRPADRRYRRSPKADRPPG